MSLVYLRVPTEALQSVREKVKEVCPSRLEQVDEMTK